ncbi:MAG TPA: hypothetical protein VHQ65_12045 [Thermoanaerobaculia bacterium]|nr:hypothetical protein [Thermoanaerobaculia bacterium]
MPFGSLWLPVVVSAVAVWLASALLHMVLKYHRADYRRLPDEAAVAAALGKGSPAPGVYTMPYCVDPAQMKDPAVVASYERGPVAMITVLRNGPPKMGKTLLQWLAFCLLASFTAAYVARHALGPDATGTAILRITGTLAFVAYGYGELQDMIWRAIPGSNVLRALFDALLYALITGLVFLWLWPGA